MKIKSKTKIIVGLIIFAVSVVGFTVLGISRVSLQSLTSVMRVIASTSFFSALGGTVGGQFLISGLKAWKQERKERKAAKKNKIPVSEAAEV